VVATLTDDGRPRGHLGVAHWSVRLLGVQLGISFASVARIWRKRRLQPWRTETFTGSTDPELDAKVRDVVGLCRDGPSFVVGAQDGRAAGSDDSVATGLPFVGTPSSRRELYVIECCARSIARRASSVQC
jgi:hypothetical protein